MPRTALSGWPGLLHWVKPEAPAMSGLFLFGFALSGLGSAPTRAVSQGRAGTCHQHLGFEGRALTTEAL
jgi:hypothetical protein